MALVVQDGGNQLIGIFNFILIYPIDVFLTFASPGAVRITLSIEGFFSVD